MTFDSGEKFEGIQPALAVAEVDGSCFFDSMRNRYYTVQTPAGEPELYVLEQCNVAANPAALQWRWVGIKELKDF